MPLSPSHHNAGPRGGVRPDSLHLAPRDKGNNSK